MHGIEPWTHQNVGTLECIVNPETYNQWALEILALKQEHSLAVGFLQGGNRETRCLFSRSIGFQWISARFHHGGYWMTARAKAISIHPISLQGEHAGGPGGGGPGGWSCALLKTMQNSKVEFMKSSPDLSFWVHFSEGYYTVFYWLDKVTFLKCDLVTLCCIRSTIGIDHSVSNSLCTLYCAKTQKTLHDTIHTHWFGSSSFAKQKLGTTWCLPHLRSADLRPRSTDGTETFSSGLTPNME